MGSDPEIQVPNLVSNHLTSGILTYIKISGRFASGINLFEKLRARDPANYPDDNHKPEMIIALNTMQVSPLDHAVL